MKGRYINHQQKHTRTIYSDMDRALKQFWAKKDLNLHCMTPMQSVKHMDLSNTVHCLALCVCI